ncbi:MAG: hypothetical protein [Microviridae sp.]|nr:MAG: hypothetical protein [Microviridae sp.]
MAAEYIRDRFNPVNNLFDHMRKTSLTVPNDSLTIEELFLKYTDGTLDIEKLAIERKALYDGENPSFDDYNPDLDAVQAYEAAYELRTKQHLNSLSHEEERISKDSVQSETPSGDSGTNREETPS